MLPIVSLIGVLQVRRGVMPDACAHWTLPRWALSVARDWPHWPSAGDAAED